MKKKLQSSLMSAVVVVWGTLAGPACFVPPLEELEQERVRTCDAQGACLPGYVCEDGLCVKQKPPPGERDCEAGEVVACGSEVGACLPGTQRCGSDGKLGPCTGAVEASAETCNGLDDDCDGETDEGLTQPCALQQGVCAGAQSTCTGGSFGACTADDYRAKDARYQAWETSCDGADNDCDGRIDNWAAQDVSRSTTTSRRAQLAPLPESESPDGMVIFYEEGQRVRAVAVDAEGGLSQPAAPTDSADEATRAWAPVLESGPAGTFAAWLEQRASRSVVLAPLGADGRSTHRIADRTEAWEVGSGGTPVNVAIAVGTARVWVATELELVGGADRAIELRSVSLPFSSGSVVSIPVGTPGVAAHRPSLHVASDDRVFLAYETGNGLQVWRVDGEGTALRVADLPNSKLTFPQVTGPMVETADYTLYAVADPSDRIARYDCAASCSFVGYRPSLGNVSGVQDLWVRGTGPTDAIAAWDQGTVSVNAVVWPIAADLSYITVNPSGVTGLRPRALEKGKSLRMVYDTEGSLGGGAPANRVILQRMCLP